jgi:hypothetical protein
MNLTLLDAAISKSAAFASILDAAILCGPFPGISSFSTTTSAHTTVVLDGSSRTFSIRRKLPLVNGKRRPIPHRIQRSGLVRFITELFVSVGTDILCCLSKSEPAEGKLCVHGMHLRHLPTVCGNIDGGAGSEAEMSSLCHDRREVQAFPAGHQVVQAGTGSYVKM